MYNPNAPRPIEAFHLNDLANAAIPADIRQQFHCDDQGHILFFSTPPLDIVPPAQQKLGHSLKYLAARDERRKAVDQRKRQRLQDSEELYERLKRARIEEAETLAARVATLTNKAVEAMAAQINSGTIQIYKALC